MRNPLLPLFGILTTLGLLLLNVQEQIVADQTVLARNSESIEGEASASRSAAYYYRAGLLVAQRREQRLNAQKTAAPKQRLLAAIDQADIQDIHKQIANTVLLSLPPTCRNTLQNFYVKYEKQKNRGLAGKSVLILDGTVPDDEFRALFIHETGHNWDLGCMQGTEAAGKSGFSDGNEAIYTDDPSVGFYQISWITSSVKRSNARPEDFVSGYASSNVFEDFAESFTYFILQNEVFAERAQENAALAQKYMWIRDTLFNGQVPTIATGTSEYKGKAPWDTTKLGYVWNK